MDEATIRRHIHRQRETFDREFAGKRPPREIADVVEESCNALSQARVTDLVPVLVYRDDREELSRRSRAIHLPVT